MQIFIEKTSFKKPLIEIVERKGIGHPDTISDSIAENIAIKLAKTYLKKFGTIFHFNVDKAFLSAGEAETRFGGGKIIKPMKLFIGDRATYRVGEEEIDIDKIVKNSALSWIKENLRFVNEENIIIQNEIKSGSEELTSIFTQRANDFMPANDTSALVGYAPLTNLEKSVLEVEKFLNSRTFKKEFPEVGEDIKVMGLRLKENYKFTFAIAFVDRFVKSEENYFKKKAEVEEKIREFFLSNFDLKPEIFVNTLDKRGFSEKGCYLTVTGTSAEAGDSGEVGRGNRVNGIISLNRPAGSEAAAGKNMISHVGKIYNLLAFKIASDIYEKTGRENYVWLLSQIGRKVNDPFAVSVQIERFERASDELINEIILHNFENLKKFIDDLIDGKYRVC